MWVIDPFLVVAAGAFGAILGSFLNVCVYRLPRGESVVRPRSRCPACGAPIAWYDNVPVVSWVLLRGRCRRCRAPISGRYPLVEAAIALVWAAAAARLGPSLEAVGAALLVTLLAGIVLTDARHFVIPDEFSLGGLGAGLAIAALTDLRDRRFAGAPLDTRLARAALGAAAGFVLLGLVKAAGDLALRRGWIGGREVQATLGPDEPVTAMGGGDVKMLAMIGAFLGWTGALTTVFLGALAGTLAYLPFLLRKTKPLVPFGVFLALGALATLLFGDRLAAWYGARLAP